MKYLLGIDQGTTQTTAVIVDENGEMIEKNSAQLPARFPQAGWVEQEHADIVRTVKEACAPLLKKYEISPYRKLLSPEVFSSEILQLIDKTITATLPGAGIRLADLGRSDMIREMRFLSAGKNHAQPLAKHPKNQRQQIRINGAVDLILRVTINQY